jgi:hypothetical protein
VTEAFGAAASLTGVDQLSPVAANAGYTQSAGMTASQSLATVTANAWVLDIQYAGADGAISPTSGQTLRLNQPVSIGRSVDRVAMTTKGPIAPAGTTTMSYSYSESSQVALSLVALRPSAP